MAFFAALVPALLRLKLSTLERVLEPTHPRRLPVDVQPHEAERIAGLVDHTLATGLPVIRSGCLTRGLTLYYFLRRAGVDAVLVFGLGRVEGEEFAGHCWVVRDGEPLLEKQDPRPLFAETYRIPSAARASRESVAGRTAPTS